MAHELHTLNLNGTNYPIQPYSFQIAENAAAISVNDKPNTWGGLGCTVHLYTEENKLPNQPCPGYIFNIVDFRNQENSTNISSYQMLMNPSTGDIYRRCGIGENWLSNWKKIINEDDLITKQDILVSGTNIKTINGNDILGAGNITIQTGEQNVKSDWNETNSDSDAYILNKPTIPTLSGYATENWVDTNYYNKSTVDKKITEAVTGGTVSLDGFATEQWVNEQGFIKSDDIPEEQFKGTVTGVKINGTTKNPSNGVVDLGEIAIIDPGGVGTYVVASGLNDATIGDTYYALPTNPDNFEANRVLATKADVTYVKEYADNIDFYTINNNPIIDGEAGTLTMIDEAGNIGIKINEDGLYAKEIIAGEHTLSNKQDKLVSGTNIKTINNESVIGSGNINTGVKIITLSSNLSSAGGTFTAEEQAIIFDNTIGTIIFNSSNGLNTWVMTRNRTNNPNMPTNMPRVYLTGLRCVSEYYRYFVSLNVFPNGTYTYTETKIATPTPVVTGTVETSQITLQPNAYVKVKDYTAGQGLLVKLATPTDNTILNEYTLEINWASSTGILTGSIAFESSDIMWLNNEAPTFTVGRTYRISIINNCAKCECFYKTLSIG